MRYFRPPFHIRGQARNGYERLPLVGLAATVLMVVQCPSVFSFDHKQRRAGRARGVTAWIKHLAEYLDKEILPNLPGPFGAEYDAGSFDARDDQSARLTEDMLVDLATQLKIGSADELWLLDAFVIVSLMVVRDRVTSNIIYNRGA